MIVECTECGTRFTLDESRLRGDSAKVRCSKCRHVFMIQKSESLPPSVAFASDSDSTPPPIEFGSRQTEAVTGQTDTPIDLFGTEPSETSFNLFSDSEPETVATAQPDDAQSVFSTTVPEQSFSDELFSFADVAPPDDEIPAPSSQRAGENEQSAAPDSFDFSFAEESKSTPVSPVEFEPIDFGMPLPETETAPQTIPVNETHESHQPESPVISQEVYSDDTRASRYSEYRPFIIAGASTVLMTIALTVGYFAFKGKPGDYQRLGIQNLKTPGEEEKGSFVIQSPEAFYVKNKHDGELFVVKASALNKYTVPRIGIEAQVTFLDKGGKPVGTAQAFCDASIEEAELSSLPYTEIVEKLSQGPSDDPLENRPVEPGKSTTCLVVTKDVPHQAVDYGIEIIHSQSEKTEDF